MKRQCSCGMLAALRFFSSSSLLPHFFALCLCGFFSPHSGSYDTQKDPPVSGLNLPPFPLCSCRIVATASSPLSSPSLLLISSVCFSFSLLISLSLFPSFRSVCPDSSSSLLSDFFSFSPLREREKECRRKKRQRQRQKQRQRQRETELERERESEERRMIDIL